MRRWLVAVLLAVALAAAAGCGEPATQPGPAPVNLDDLPGAEGVRGARLGQPVAKPDLRLSDTAGQTYDLRSRTAGKLTLLFFGYTNCPDICPTTMADLAAALGQVPPEVREQVTVVFVTSDPDRDSPGVLGRWLAQFDSSFVGLTGPFEVVAGYAEQVGVELFPPEQQADGTWISAHGTQVTAFSPDGTANVAYEAGTSVADYAHDIPLLARGES